MIRTAVCDLELEPWNSGKLSDKIIKQRAMTDMFNEKRAARANSSEDIEQSIRENLAEAIATAAFLNTTERVAMVAKMTEHTRQASLDRGLAEATLPWNSGEQEEEPTQENASSLSPKSLPRPTLRI